MVDNNSYTKTAIRLHWIIAFLIIALLFGGKLMGFIPGENLSLKIMIYNWHKTIGLLILVLSVARLVWRLTHKPPPLPSSITGFPKLLSKFTHIFFYVFMIAMPLIGWSIISTSRLPSKFFNLFPMPQLPFWKNMAKEPKHDAHEFFENAHEKLAYIAMALILLHVAAAIKHHRSGGEIMERMIPSLKNKKRD
ncbi:MAG: cytochrome b [Robiginitomaculum sp.]|nr:cytochrome b [Robiginitomaculum sp.]